MLLIIIIIGVFIEHYQYYFKVLIFVFEFIILGFGVMIND